MNTKLHAICDSKGRPLNLFVTAGHVSDYIPQRSDSRSRLFSGCNSCHSYNVSYVAIALFYVYYTAE